ncbi:IS3 family transposase, partial [Shigella sonnei]
LAKVFKHYNEWHPHSAQGYRLLRKYLKRRTSNGENDSWFLKI